MKRVLVGSAAIAAAGIVAMCAPWLASATTTIADPGPVHFAGCIRPGVEANCLIVESDGKTYNVSSAKSILKVGQFAAGTGIPGGMSSCQQGIVLGNIVLDNPQPPHADCAK